MGYWDFWSWKKTALFAGGVLFGSAGLKLLGSEDARRAYAHVTAAALRCKDSVMASVDKVQECAGDVLADAKAINEERAKAHEIVEDAADGADGAEAVDGAAEG